MPTNLLNSFNALFIGSTDKERRSNVINSSGCGGNELIEEWPRRSISIKRKSKPPSSINVPVKPANFSVATCQDNSGHHSRRNSCVTQQHRNKTKNPTIEDHDESSRSGTTTDSTLFNSLNSAATDMSCYSLNDMPSSSSVHTRITSSRNSISTAPGLSRMTSRRSIRRDVNHDRRTRTSSIGTRSSRSRASRKKNVRFTEDAPSLHLYDPVAPNTHYTADDDDSFRQYTLTLARGVLRLLKVEAVHDESFDVLTGLPSANCLRRYLNYPDVLAEEVVGIEDLLAGPGIARARKRLKIVQTKKLLAEQRRQMQLGINDPMSIAKSLRKTSSISSNIARCRAAYAFGIGIEGTETGPNQSLKAKERLSKRERRVSKRDR